MLYYLLRPVTRLAFLGFYRRIRMTGRERVPQGVPVIFTVNHPTAFIEPCFLACYSGRNLHFMTRGDVFVNPWVQWLLRQVHLIPVFRFIDGMGNLRRNERSFREARDVLRRKGAVLIMAEGGMRHEKRLRPIQRGAARMAFDALEKDGLQEVYIQPVAVNYTAADRARSEMMISYLPSFPVRPYWPMYQEKPQAALDLLTSKIAQALRTRVVHIDRPEDEAVTECILDLLREPGDSRWWPVFLYEEETLVREMAVADRINQLPPADKQALKQACTSYREALTQADMSNRELALALAPFPVKSQLAGKVLRLLNTLAFLPLLVPVWLSRWLTARTVKVIEFRSSVLIGSLMFTGLLWYALCALIGLVVWGLSAFIIILVLWPLGGVLYLATLPLAEIHAAAKLFQRLDTDQRGRLGVLRNALYVKWGRYKGPQKDSFSNTEGLSGESYSPDQEP